MIVSDPCQMQMHHKSVEKISRLQCMWEDDLRNYIAIQNKLVNN